MTYLLIALPILGLAIAGIVIAIIVTVVQEVRR